MPEDDDSNKKLPNGGSISVGLTILFICLKLAGLIDWSWWIILSPLLFEVAIVLFLMLMFFIVFVFCEFVFGSLNL